MLIIRNYVLKEINVVFFSFLLIFLFPAKTFSADIEAILDDASGSSAFSVKDSGSTEIFHVDSDGRVIIKTCLRIDSGGTECSDTEGLIVDGIGQ